MLVKAGRVLGILAVVVVIAAFGWWLGGPERRLGPFLPGPPTLPSAADGARESGLPVDTGTEAGLPGGAPLWPEGVKLLEKAQLDREGMRGCIFSVALVDREKVIQFYRDLFARQGWHELPGNDRAGLAKAGLDAEHVSVFAGRTGTFFLGWSGEKEAANFVVIHAAREGD